ncbi:MAG: TSUP family transporter [Clostridia bacterium]|nr:TSUP family transporter [Clostridia bacterium]
MTKFLFFIAGLSGGILAGMGMGGGTLTIPLLVMFLHTAQLDAQFVNLIAFLPTGIVALFLHIKNGLVSKNHILPLLIPALFMCVVTSFFAVETGDMLGKFFGVFLIVVAIFSLSSDLVKKR